MLTTIATAAASTGTNTGLVVAIAGGTGVATSAIISFFASAYGQRREDRRARELWLRDNRLAAYTAFEAAVVDLAGATFRVDWADREIRAALAMGDTPPDIPRPDFVSLWIVENTASTRALLLGPESVRTEIALVHERLTQAYEANENPPSDLTEAFGVAAIAALSELPPTWWQRRVRRPLSPR